MDLEYMELNIFFHFIGFFSFVNVIYWAIITFMTPKTIMNKNYMYICMTHYSAKKQMRISRPDNLTCGNIAGLKWCNILAN